MGIFHNVCVCVCEQWFVDDAVDDDGSWRRLSHLFVARACHLFCSPRPFHPQFLLRQAKGNIIQCRSIIFVHYNMCLLWDVRSTGKQTDQPTYCFDCRLFIFFFRFFVAFKHFVAANMFFSRKYLPFAHLHKYLRLLFCLRRNRFSRNECKGAKKKSGTGCQLMMNHRVVNDEIVTRINWHHSKKQLMYVCMLYAAQSYNLWADVRIIKNQRGQARRKIVKQFYYPMCFSIEH